MKEKQITHTHTNSSTEFFSTEFDDVKENKLVRLVSIDNFQLINRIKVVAKMSINDTIQHRRQPQQSCICKFYQATSCT